jgi:RimJ/RimL family protein N-acetyltransferase
VELATARLRLDALHDDDAGVLFQYRSEPSVALYQGWCPATLAEALDFIRAQQYASLDKPDTWLQRAIRHSSHGVLIGDVGVHVPYEPDGSYEFGITLAPSYQGKGFAREALRALFDYLFGTIGAHRVHASIDPRNLASAALLRSVGMRQEAHFRENLKIRGEWVDDVVFALLASEWPLGRAGD